MPKSWYTIKAAAEGADTVEVSILDYIGAYGVNARTFLNELRASKAATVKVHINSPGGSVFEALAMFNGLRASGKTVEVHVMGVAASAASYIAMAGDRVVMPENTFMFVHNPINQVYGNAEDMREMAELLDKVGESLLLAYKARWKGTEQALKDTLAAESYLTAAECLEYGLCDEVTEPFTAEASFDVDDLPEQLRVVFHAAAAASQAPAKPTVAEIKAAVEAAGLEAHMAAFALDDTLATRDDLTAAISAAAEVRELCDALKASARVGEFIQARTSMADVRKALAAERAQQSAATEVSAARPAVQAATTPADFSPTGLLAEIQQMKQQAREARSKK